MEELYRPIENAIEKAALRSEKQQAEEAVRRYQMLAGPVPGLAESKKAEETRSAGEKRLHRILRQSPAGVVETDATGHITLVNRSWCEMLGYSEAELLQTSVIELTHPSSLEATLEAVGRLAKGGPDFQIEKNYRRKDGSIMRVNSNVSALRGADGDFQGLVAVVLDLTKRIEAEEAVREAKRSCVVCWTIFLPSSALCCRMER